MQVRAEQANDREAIFELNAEAFDSAFEAELVDRLRVQCDETISLVAIDDREIIGHILFTPVTLAGEDSVRMFGLGPMAVSPAHQRRGVGSALVRNGLEQCRAAGVEAVVVLGHPEYYPRFGFERASGHGMDSDYPAPDEAFMVLELVPDALRGKSGRVSYHPAFDG